MDEKPEELLKSIEKSLNLSIEWWHNRCIEYIQDEYFKDFKQAEI